MQERSRSVAGSLREGASDSPVSVLEVRSDVELRTGATQMSNVALQIATGWPCDRTAAMETVPLRFPSCSIHARSRPILLTRTSPCRFA